METSVLNHQRQESVAFGEQRLYERLHGLRQFRLAPFDGVTVPTVEDLHAVEGYDYSRDGFSYWSLEKPATEFVVIELCYHNRANYHEAKIVHHTQAAREGATWHLVGCQFTKRIELAAARASERNASSI